MITSLHLTIIPQFYSHTTIKVLPQQFNDIVLLLTFPIQLYSIVDQGTLHKISHSHSFNKSVLPTDTIRKGSFEIDSMVFSIHVIFLNANVLSRQYRQCHFEKYRHIRANFYAKNVAQRNDILKLIFNRQ